MKHLPENNQTQHQGPSLSQLLRHSYFFRDPISGPSTCTFPGVLRHHSHNSPASIRVAMNFGNCSSEYLRKVGEVCSIWCKLKMKYAQKQESKLFIVFQKWLLLKLWKAQKFAKPVFFFLSLLSFLIPTPYKLASLNMGKFTIPCTDMSIIPLRKNALQW